MLATGRRALAEAPRGLLLLPVIGAAIGGAAILISDRGVADRPALSALILAAAVVAGLAPLRYGFPIAVVLACFEGFMVDFAGDPALYWNEVFIALLVARSLWRRRPTRVECLVAAAFAVFFLGYLAAGTKPLAVFWGAKVLLTSAVAAWAIARMRGLGRREWLATYYGLATAVAASLVLAAWQRHVGAVELLARGISRDRVRFLEEALRAFAGFTKASPFAYTLGLVLLCWLALALSSRERAVALWTVWLPFAAATGLVWTHNRLTPLALGVAVVAVAAREVFSHRPRAIWLVALAITAGGVAVGAAFQHWSDSPSATFRTMIWREYLRELSPFGAGPASAGSAYRRADFRPWLPPLTFGSGWAVRSIDDPLVAQVTSTGTLLVAAGDARFRPPLTLRGAATSLPLPSRLVVRLRGQVLFRGRIPADRYRLIRVLVPPGVGAAKLVVGVTPLGRPTNTAPRGTVISIRAPHVLGVPRARTPTTRVYQRVWERDRELQRNPAGFPAGLVDNQYVSWLFQYGIFGGALCVLWTGAVLVPLVRRAELRSLAIAGGLTGSFLVAAAFGVNVWEESPAELVAAVVIGLTYASVGLRKLQGGGAEVN